MKINTIMTEKVTTVEMDDTLGTIGKIFIKAKFHHLLVVDKQRLCGIISDRDFLKTSSPFLNSLSEKSRDTATLNKRAHQIMTRDPIIITKETSLEEAAKLMLQHDVSCLPVILSDSRIAGLVTWKDIIKYFIEDSNTD